MPIYEYANDALGIEIPMHFALADRPDEIVLKRRTVPTRVTIGTGAQAPTINDRLAAGYKALESKGLLKDGPNTLSTAEIKRAIAEPAT